MFNQAQRADIFEAELAKAARLAQEREEILNEPDEPACIPYRHIYGRKFARARVEANEQWSQECSRRPQATPWHLCSENQAEKQNYTTSMDELTLPDNRRESVPIRTIPVEANAIRTSVCEAETIRMTETDSPYIQDRSELGTDHTSFAPRTHTGPSRPTFPLARILRSDSNPQEETPPRPLTASFSPHPTPRDEGTTPMLSDHG